MTVRTHMGHKPVEGSLRDSEQEAEIIKPRGFWYSVDGSWEEWCKAEDFSTGTIRHVVELDPACKILRIDTPGALLDFTHDYPRKLTRSWDFAQIDWVRVAQDYDGVEIAPYQACLRLEEEVRWYYGWDCASGCVWKPKGTRVEVAPL